MNRPRFKIPLWAAFAVPVAAFIIRSVGIRGGNFSIDVPEDLIVFAVLGGAVAAVAWARRTLSGPSEDESGADSAPEVDRTLD